MGASYHNIVLLGVSQEQIVDLLRERQDDTYVSPTINNVVFNVVFVYDREGYYELASALSDIFHCPAWSALVYDSDVFMYALYDSGEKVDEYASDPRFLDDAESNTEDWDEGGNEELPVIPFGGDARRLCAAFGADAAAPEVDAFLRRPGSSSVGDASDTFVFEEERHWAIAEALGLPAAACIYGYDYIVKGEGAALEEEFGGARLVKTLG